MMKQFNRTPSRFLLLAAVCLCAGCVTQVQSERVATFISPDWEASAPARIVVVPFGAPADAVEGRELLTEAIALQLQRTLHADVFVAEAEDKRIMAEAAMWRRGRVDLDALIETQRRYNADAFLFGAITRYKQYDPPIIGLKLGLLSASSGEALWAAEAVFDAHNPYTRANAQEYFRYSGMKNVLYGEDLVLMSPRLFARFAAVELVKPLATHIYGEDTEDRRTIATLSDRGYRTPKDCWKDAVKEGLSWN